MKPPEKHQKQDPGTEAIWKALNEVADPEFPVSIVEMGLIYSVKREQGCVTIEMTFTSMGCPCMEMMLYDVEQQVRRIPGIDEVKIEIVWDPPWTPEKLAPHAVEQLATWGVSV